MGGQSNSHEPGISAAGHIPAVDGLRGLAILLVFLCHQTVLAGTSPLDRGVLTATRLGWCGVDLFFALSGFLITGILFDAKGGRGYFRNFYARRALRIFPLYYAVLFVVLFLFPRVLHVEWKGLGGASDNAWWYWCYLSNLLVALTGRWGTGALAVSWSLAIEEQFYLVWPLVVFLCSRRTLLCVCGAVAVASLLLRCGLLAAGVGPLAVYVLTPARLDVLALGAWVALAARGERGLAGPRRLAHVVLPLGVAGLVALVLTHHGEYTDPWMQTAGYTALAFVGACCVSLGASAAPGGITYRFLTCRPLRSLGKYSYAIYLLHQPICYRLREAAHVPGCFPTVLGSQLPAQLVFYLAAGAMVWAAAWLSWHAFEAPILRLKTFFPAHLPAPAGNATQPLVVLRDNRRKPPRDAGQTAPGARRPVPVSGQ